ncbi:replication protein RepA [Desulfovibrio sp.]|uniref:replication protein RepA n=1 Tax=Desulfovibrio sp. TaxID=885 RepID=UPI0025BCEF0A|nr:replication protein RepA [Desulfovibrio sp.]
MSTLQVPQTSALSIHEQIEMFGLEACRDLVMTNNTLKPAERKKQVRRLEAAQQAMLDLGIDDISYLHAGLCQTGLPHSKPDSDNEPWQRSNGKFHLIVEPGALVDPATGKAKMVGVPYGAKARLIFLHINSEGMKSKHVYLGKSMSAWMRRLGLDVTGGKTGSIPQFKEQSKRLGRARFSFQFESENGIGISDTQIADKLHLWVSDDGPWLEEIELTDKFFDHLREHAVPLSDHAISYLSSSCLKLDLYAWLAWRLPKLGKPLRLSWDQLKDTFSAQGEPGRLAERLKLALPEVKDVYRDMNVEIARGGLLLKPSKPPIPKTLIAVSKK